MQRLSARSHLESSLKPCKSRRLGEALASLWGSQSSKAMWQMQLPDPAKSQNQPVTGRLRRQIEQPSVRLTSCFTPLLPSATRYIRLPSCANVVSSPDISSSSKRGALQYFLRSLWTCTAILPCWLSPASSLLASHKPCAILENRARERDSHVRACVCPIHQQWEPGPG